MTVRRTAATTAAVVAVVCGLAVALPADAGPGPAADFTPGGAGIGDPYYPVYGNGGYLVDHYDVDVAYDPDSLVLTGHTVVEATATQDLSRFNLDLLLEVSRVRVDGERARFRQRGAQELVVTPSQGVADGQSFEVAVDYSGVPSDAVGPGSVQTWVTTPDGAVAVGEPEVAAWWFPSNDHPRDRALFDIAITVPTGVEAISNGTHTGTEPAGGGRRTWHWSPAEPMATYLAFMAVGQYAIEEGSDSGGRPYLYAFSTRLDSGVADRARRSLRQTAGITRFLETKFGPYPFDQVGGVVPGDFGYALENQTRPLYSSSFFGGVNPIVVAHEMAHQWYGDAVTVRNWRDIWLNEGFATYAEYLLTARGAAGTPTQETFLTNYRAHPPASSLWDLRIGDPGAHNEFANPVYERGGMTLQALRNKLGSHDFFALLRAWAAAGGSRRIADFVDLAESYRGAPLDRFFRVWLYTGARPAPTVANGVHPPG